MPSQRTLAALVAIALAVPQLSSAATIQVDSVVDVLADDGVCTLREAVIAANSDAASGAAAGECVAGPGADVIQVSAGTYVLAIPGAAEDAAVTGDLDLRTDMEIAGVGAAATIVDAADLDRVFQVHAGAAVEIRDLTIRNGWALTPAPVRGGGLQNLGTLFLRRCLLTGNLSSGGFGSSPVGSGGAIHNAAGASLSVEDSSVSDNDCENAGGGILNEGILVMNRSTIERNDAFRLLSLGGGGIYHSGGSATISNSTFSRNRALGFGGAFGGAVSASAPMTLSHCTLTGNDVPAQPPGFRGQSLSIGSATITLVNTILDGDCSGLPAASLGGNVETIGDTCDLTDSSDQTNVPAAALGLGTLAANGGITPTHALAAASVARDSAVGTTCLATDQRGVTRPDGDSGGGGACDSGAFEFADCDASGVDDGIEISAGTLPDANGNLVPDACDTVRVEIDILPGSERNPIRTGRRGLIPVAILGGEEFDVNGVDDSTLVFGPAAAGPGHRGCPHPADVNGDGLLDLVVHFPSRAAGITRGDLEACVAGALLDGTPIEGCDGIAVAGASR